MFLGTKTWKMEVDAEGILSSEALRFLSLSFFVVTCQNASPFQNVLFMTNSR